MNEEELRKREISVNGKSDVELKELYRKKQIKTMKECIEDAEQVANETYAEVESCKVAVTMFEKRVPFYYYWKKRKQEEEEEEMFK